jgi:hypothetical protein
MAKKKAGEQQTLMDIEPEHSKEMIALAKKYKKHQKARMAALEAETDTKQKILDLIRKDGIKPIEDGKIKFSVDGVTFKVTPRDELVQVKFAEEAEDAE